MKIWPFNRGYALLLIAFTVTWAPTVLAADVKAGAENQKAQTAISADIESAPIQIAADRLLSDRLQRFAEFIGNVKVVQGSTQITADRLKIFYKENADNAASKASAAGSIRQLVASGHVTINFDNKVAVTKRAVYITETSVLVLSGTDSKISDGKNSIAGEKITVYRAEDRITVEGGSRNRVEAVFFTNDKGLQ